MGHSRHAVNAHTQYTMEEGHRSAVLSTRPIHTTRNSRPARLHPTHHVARLLERLLHHNSSLHNYRQVTQQKCTTHDRQRMHYIHCVSKKHDTDVAHYNFNAHQPISVIFGRDVAEYAIKWCFAISPLLTNVSALPGETWTLEIGSFQLLYTVSRKRHCFGLIYFRHSSTNLNSCL